MQKEEVSLLHNFNDHELALLGREQAGSLDKLATLEHQLDSAKKQFASQISEAKAHISSVSTRVHAGSEYRTVPCGMLDNRPEGLRLVVRLDNGHIWKRRQLKAEERQLVLSTEAPRPYVAVALLQIDDQDWRREIDACEIPIYEDEFAALHSLPDVKMRDYIQPSGYLNGNTEEPQKTNKKKRRGKSDGSA